MNAITTTRLNLLPAMALAGAITLGLLLVMQMLISSELEAPEKTSVTIAPIIMENEGPKLLPTDERPEPVDDPEPAPPMPEQQIAVNLDPGLNFVHVPKVPTGIEVTGGSPGVSEREPIPRVRVAAVYPSRAATQGIEGYVDLRFVITANGSTENIEVIYAEPSSIFNRAAVKAVKRWKYAPKLVDGEPVRREGVETRMSFRLDKQ